MTQEPLWFGGQLLRKIFEQNFRKAFDRPERSTQIMGNGVSKSFELFTRFLQSVSIKGNFSLQFVPGRTAGADNRGSLGERPQRRLGIIGDLRSAISRHDKGQNSV